MFLDFSNIPFDSYGRPETPTLFLQTLNRETVGIISGVSDLSIRIKFSEPSEMAFDVSATIESDGKMVENPIYSQISGYKIIHTKAYGNYIIESPEMSSDGSLDVIHVQAYSLEKQWEKKMFFLEEGTHDFWDPASPTNTVLGRMIELMPGWIIGYVSPTLIGKYRTFDQYDDYLLDFAYNTAPEKYRCVFVFDTYEMSINVYDIDEQYDTLPIYLDFDNLIKEVTVSELTDEIVTAISPYGEDDLDIRSINPIGTNWLYNLDYFIANGDIPPALAAKWNQWQADILARQEMYYGLVSLVSSRQAQIFLAEAKKTDAEGIKTGYLNNQSITLQAQAMEITDAGKAARALELENINRQIATQDSKINEIQTQINTLNSEMEAYDSEIKSIVSQLKFDNYFTDAEQQSLSNYIIESTLTEETFVSSDFSGDGTEVIIMDTSTASVAIANSSISEITMSEEYGKIMYAMDGGKLTYTGGGNEPTSVTGDIIRAVLERNTTGNGFVFTAYLGKTVAKNETRYSATLTMYGQSSNFTSDIHEVSDGDVVTREGTSASFTGGSDTVSFLSASVSGFEKYSVQLELYDFAKDKLKDMASPTYEFSVDSGNFIFAKEFEPFRNALQLGKGIHLNLSHGILITPYLIELEVHFDEHESLDLVFSNHFKRHDQVNTLKDMIEQSYSSSRNFDASKYTYNRTVSKQSDIDRFMSGALDAAKNTILGASDQSVVIDGAGIRVNGGVTDANQDKNIELRIVNGMIAMTDDNWNSAKLAIGYFKTENGSYYGVNADVIAGKLLVGNNLIIENTTDNGVMQFKVDETGAWLHNSQFLLQSDNGGSMMLHPEYGFAAGEGTIYTTSGTTVTPSFIENGELVLDSDGMPEDVNFYVSMGGDVYVRGKINSTEGSIGGWKIGDNLLYSGANTTYVALNTSGENTASAYAIWVGAETPGAAPFYVMRDGTVRMSKGAFGGSINVGNNFIVDDNGNVTLKGNVTWTENNNPTVNQVYVLYARTALSTPSQQYSTYPDSSTGGWHKNIDTTNDFYASYSYDNGKTWSPVLQIKGKDGDSSQVLVLYAKSKLAKPTGQYDDYPNSNTSSGDSWHKVLDDTTDFYASYSYDDGATWTEPIRIQGTNATVTRERILEVLDGQVDGIYNDNGKISVKATSALVGGWGVAEHMLSSGSGNTYVALNSDGENNSAPYAIWAGAYYPADAPFSVKRDGTVKVTSGLFKGEINVNNNFIVDSSGNVTLNGNITWGTGNDPTVDQVYTLYSQTSLSKPTSKYATYPSTSSNFWHKSLDSANDLYVSYSYDNGNTWTDALILQGQKGDKGDKGDDGDDATVTRSALLDLLNNSSDGIYKTSNNTIGIRTSVLSAGEIGVEKIHLDGNMTVYKSSGSNESGGYIGYATGSDTKSDTPGMHMMDSTENSEVIVTSAGARMQVGDSAAWLVASSFSLEGISHFSPGTDADINIGTSTSRWNNIYAANSVIQTSDRNEKKDISYDMDQYLDLFDLLKPASFKLKNGTSGRTHTGFIAQDVEAALRKAGIDSKDFAAFIKDVTEDDEEVYGLRYGEFVSLLVAKVKQQQEQIDELFSRIDQME